MNCRDKWIDNKPAYVLSLIALMLISNSTLKPIREIIATSKQYAAGNFNARIDFHTDNEFGELARYIP